MYITLQTEGEASIMVLPWQAYRALRRTQHSPCQAMRIVRTVLAHGEAWATWSAYGIGGCRMVREVAA